MKEPSIDSRLVIKIVKGHFGSTDSYADAEKFIADDIYGVTKIDRFVLCRYLREVLLDAKDYSLESWEHFHADALQAAFHWTGDFSWKQYVVFHFSAICGLYILDKIDLTVTQEDEDRVSQVINKSAAASP